MVVSDWITVISIFFAVVAIYPANERAIISFKLFRGEIIAFIFSLFYILYLIKFDTLANSFQFLQIFYTHWGIAPNNWALILFIGLLAYATWRLFFSIPYLVPNEKLIKFYVEKINQNFDIFYPLFNKYEKKASDTKYFEKYQDIVFNIKFISETSNRNPYQFVELLEKMDKSTFKPFFTHVLRDTNSVFYQEIKLNDNSYTAESNNVFLTEICHRKPALFIDIGGLILLREWYLVHLQSEKLLGRNSLYNQPPELLIDNYAFSLPLYYHISFIALLYNEAINEHYDFSRLSKRYTNMQSIYATMIDRMIDNIDVEEYRHHTEDEYPLGYHYLISKIFSFIGHWLDSFIENDNYNKDSSLVIFIPFCFSLCMKSLYKGYYSEKISVDFIKSIYRYHLIDRYLSHNIKPEIQKEINERCIKEIPKQLVEPIIGYALNAILAVSFGVFKDGKTARAKSLYECLVENDLI